MNTSLPSAQEQSIKRLNINLPAKTFNELQSLSEAAQRSMTDVVRTALSLVRIAYEEHRKGNKLAVVSDDGVIVKEIVLP